MSDLTFRMARVTAHLDIDKPGGKDFHPHDAALLDSLRRDLDGGKEAAVTQHLGRPVAHVAQTCNRLVGVGKARPGLVQLAFG